MLHGEGVERNELSLDQIAQSVMFTQSMAGDARKHSRRVATPWNAVLELSVKRVKKGVRQAIRSSRAFEKSRFSGSYAFVHK